MLQQKVIKMYLLRSLTLVFLIFGFFAFAEPEDGANAQKGNGALKPQNLKSCGTEPLGPGCERNELPETFDENTQLRCGPNQRVLSRTSIYHHCCGYEQFDNRTHCCCFLDGRLQIRPNGSSDCNIESGVEQQVQSRSSIKRDTHLCECSSQNKHCCEREERKSCGSAPHPRLGPHDAVPTPCTHACVCCDGCVWKPGMNQCHGSPGQHCCGTKVFKSCAEICCHGHRHEREENVNRCGVCSYNINVPHVRCCCGTLYNLQSFCTKAVDAECCGFVLLTPEGGVFTADQKVWCSGAQQLLLYLTKARFRCCSQKCCNPCNHGVTKHQQDKNDQDSRFLSVDNLNEAELCGEIYVGTVESVFLYSVVFKSVLKIHGRNGTVAPLPNILPVPHRCDPFKLIPGSTHFFNEANVIIDFNHRSVIQALHFVFSKCFHS